MRRLTINTFLHDRGRALVTVVVSLMAATMLLLTTLPVMGTGARFTDTQTVGSNTFTTKADWEAPTTSASVLVNSIGYAGILKQGGTYQVCANVSDGGNPASGVSTVRGNLAVASNVITTGLTSVTLSSGSVSCAGTTYGYSTATQTANASITAGSKTFSITSTDTAGNAATTNWTATIDNTAPTLSSMATANKAGGTAGKIEASDSFSVVVSESTIDLTRIISGWSGSSTAVFVKLLNNGAPSTRDGLWVCSANDANCAAGTSASNILGVLDLNNTAYVSATVVFNATIAWTSGTRTFLITIGTCVSGCASVTTGGSSTATFRPISGSAAGGIRDTASNNTSTGSTVTEAATHF